MTNYENTVATRNDKDASKPVARHFNLPNHSKQHMAICGLSLHFGSLESHKTLEQKFIFQIGTLGPCPHVSGYFWKRWFFSPFSKKYASTRSLFKSYSPVHTNTQKPGKYASSLYRACAVTNRACAVEETGAREIHFLAPSLRGKDWILNMTSSYSKTSV